MTLRLTYCAPVLILIGMDLACKPRNDSQTLENNENNRPNFFEEIIAQSQNGTVPFPFEKLVAHISSASKSDPIAIMTPLGRSLQKNAASPRFFASPRVLVGFTDSYREDVAELSPQIHGLLYLGYVERAGQVEILAYNSHTGSNDLLVIDDYTEHGAKNLHRVEPFRCQSCHIRNHPVFSVEPWSEFNGNPQISRLIQHHHGDTYLGISVKQSQRREGGDQSRVFEDLISNSYDVQAAQHLWKGFCALAEEPIVCRKMLLKLAFSTPTLDIVTWTQEDEVYLDRLINRAKSSFDWLRLERLMLVTSLSDMNLAEKLNASLEPMISELPEELSDICKRKLTSPNVNHRQLRVHLDSFLSDQGEKGTSFELVECLFELAFRMPLDGFEDPRSGFRDVFTKNNEIQRIFREVFQLPNTLSRPPKDLVKLIGEKIYQVLFSKVDAVRLSLLKNNSENKNHPNVAQILEVLAKNKAPSLRNNVLVRTTIMEEIQMAGGQSRKWQSLGTKGTIATEQPATNPNEAMPVSHAGLKIIQRRCSRCHDGSISFVPVLFDRTESHNESSAWQRVLSQKDKVIGALEVGEGIDSYMPPASSLENRDFSDEERRTLLRLIKAN